ncbi:MAG: HEAT repeat domain-containing protein [Planctomycetota bacterium]|nr:HEAT repeat domain-containing protein [Planctomycetota bacterium]
MDKRRERELAEKAHALGESGDGGAVAELIRMQCMSSIRVRRMAVSALGKLAGLVDANTVVPALISRLRDDHPQVRQYAIKALSGYGDDATPALADLQDICDNQNEKEYNRRDAMKAVATIREAGRIALAESKPRCQKCDRVVTADEYVRAMRAFQRVYCDSCFNEVYLRRRNFDTKVELNKTIPTRGGTWVQSDGERIIANYLTRHDIAYRYDERLQIIDGYAIRPDFYLPEFDLYIEYWGMDTTDYKIGMLKKQKLYQQQGKKLISVSFRDKHMLEQVLQRKLARYVRMTGDNEAQRS